MKQTILLSIAAAALLFSGCSEETKKAATETATAAKETTQSAVKDVKETAQKTVEATKEAATPMVEAVKEKTTEAVETAKAAAAPVVEAAKAKVVEAADVVKEAAAPAVVPVTETVEEAVAPAIEAVEEKVTEATEAVAVDTEAGKALYAKCTSCHGADGKTPALGKSVAIAGQSAAELETKLAEYKAGTRDVAGMGTLMKAQVVSMSDEDIKAVSAYIATF